jgi:anti-sigma regulatory factor (Ser/Thr protein kinase)
MSPPQRTRTEMRPSEPDTHDRFALPSETIMLAPRNVNVATARRFATRWFARAAALDPASDELYDLGLMTSELVTNAFEHGDDQAVEIRVSFDGVAAMVSVASHGPEQLAPASDWAVAGVDAASGRGLGIVRSLADDIHIDRSDGRLTIGVTRRLR